MEHNGLPVSPVYGKVKEYRNDLRLEIARQVEMTHGYGVYEIEGQTSPQPVFKQRGFDALIQRLGLAEIWPQTPRGHCSTEDENVLEPMAKRYPELQPLRQARKSIRNLNLFGTRIGEDGRNRAPVWPFGTVTGRNSPKTSQFILNRPHWVRNLIAPTEGHALVHADIVAAEVGIAADASGDPELLRIYNSGLDPYIEFAKSGGALPSDTVRDKANRPDIERIRTLYKVADLAIKYGIGGATLASNLGIPLWKADRIIASHKRTYATYWAWAEAQIEQAYRVGHISTAFGWTMAVDPGTKRNTVLNFPQQAACAELLRLTCVLAEERGLGSRLCAPRACEDH
jgi:DNA polymerase I